MINKNPNSDKTEKIQKKTRGAPPEFLFKKGQSGNPAGRPPGSISITTEIKKKLNEIPEGQKKTYLELLINRILKLGVVDGNEQMIKQIWAYIDGMPKERRDITSGGEKIMTAETNPAIKELADKLNKLDETHFRRNKPSDGISANSLDKETSD